jgi:hypothetical protein
VNFTQTTESVRAKLNPMAAESLDIDQLKDLFYQCKFIEVLTTIENSIPFIRDLATFNRAMLLKSKVFYELNKVEDSKRVLEDCMNRNRHNFDLDSLYVKASFEYFNGEFEEAKSSFQFLLEQSTHADTQFKALLGLGNICYSKKDATSALEYIREMAKMVDGLDDDLRLSFHLLEANILMNHDINSTRARELFEAVYEKARENKWEYFNQRSLYNLAKWFKREGRLDEAKGVLHVLSLNLRQTDSRFLTFLTNEEFDKLEFKSTQHFSIDKDNATISLGNQDKYEVDLSRWPLLFKFISLLSHHRNYVSKAMIAAHLWPEQDYKPKTHDARIYDIVARIKKKIEIFEDKPLVLESSPKGYRLNIK